jgi:tetratricopeptide (TPR) repeat protein
VWKNSVRGIVASCVGALLAAPAFFALPDFIAPRASAAQTSVGSSVSATTPHTAFPQEARDGLETLYRGDPDAALEIFHGIENSHPGSPLGYLLEGEARWWKIYCSSLDLKWNQIDAYRREPAPEDDAYLRLAGKAISLAEDQLQRKETAEMHLYAGMGYALRARLFGLRKENRATARAGVRAREHFLRALELDPRLSDADTGLGLYNYYVDTLSTIARVLRYFMGIPGGSKEDGIRQLETAMVHGELTAVDARFYLSKNLRTYDQQYQRAVEVLEPLTAQYPRNPIFALMLGNLYALLGRNDRAAAIYHSAESMPISDPDCKDRISAVAHKGLDALNAPSK